MMVQRGDVVTIDFPFTSGMQSKVRPALVVQNDADNQQFELKHFDQRADQIQKVWK